MIEVWKVALSLSLSGAILICMIWPLSRLLGARLGRHWQYYVWLVVVVRLLIPFTPEVSLLGQLYADTPPTARQQSAIDPDQEELSQNSAPMTEPLTPEPANGATHPIPDWGVRVLNSLWVVWLLVALILLIRKITLYQSFGKYLRAGRTEITDPKLLNLLGEVCEQARVKRPMEIYTNHLITSPLIMGLIKPYIVLPHSSYHESGLRYILMHELIHYKRLDLFYKWLLQLVLCLHWFNPLIHRMVQEANRTCELSCDESVLEALDAASYRQYGNTLIDSLNAPGTYREGIAALTLSESAEQLKERLDAIMAFKKKNIFRVITAVVLSLCLMAGGFALGSYSAKGQWNDFNGQLTEEGLPVMSAKNRNLYESYMKPFAVAALFYTNFSEEDISALVANDGSILENVFNVLNPEVFDEHAGAVPAALVEETLMSKLPLQQWMIQEAFGERYQEATQTYELYGGMGGGPAALIVTDSRQDGKLLTVRYIWYVGSQETPLMQPSNHGEAVIELDGDAFRIISNQLSES